MPSRRLHTDCTSFVDAHSAHGTHDDDTHGPRVAVGRLVRHALPSNYPAPRQELGDAQAQSLVDAAADVAEVNCPGMTVKMKFVMFMDIATNVVAISVLK